MSKEFFFDWLTVEFPAGGGDYVQPQEDWADLGADGTTVVIAAQVPAHGANVAAILETAASPGGKWVEVPLTPPSGGEPVGYAQNIYLGVGTDVPDSNRVQRYLRWHVQATDAGVLCMRASVMVK